MNRIKLLREENHITQEELAKKLELSKGIISLYEKEDRKPSLEILLKLSEIFNCSIDYLLCKTTLKNYEKEDQKFFSTYQKEIEGLTEDEIIDALRLYKQMKKNYEQNKNQSS